MPLSKVEVGSYVAYTGNNGCPSEHCDGTNANSSDTSNGYCKSAGENTKTGRRIWYPYEKGSCRGGWKYVHI